MILKKGIFNHWKKDVNYSLVKKTRKMSCICNYAILYFGCFLPSVSDFKLLN